MALKEDLSPYSSRSKDAASPQAKKIGQLFIEETSSVTVSPFSFCQ